MRTGYRDLLIITAVYTLAHGLMLVLNGIYWDDWIIASVDRTTLFERFFQMGLPWNAYIHWLFWDYGGVFGYRLVTFMAYLLAALALNGVLKSVQSVDRVSRLFLVMLFAVTPLNIARIAAAALPSASAYALFFIAYWLTIRHITGRLLILRPIALLLFLLSFTESLVVPLYVVVIAHIYCLERQLGSLAGLRLDILRRYTDFLVCPIVFLGIKELFFRPTGLFVFDQGVSLTAFSFSKILNALYWPIIDTFGYAAANYKHVYLSIVIALICAYLLRQQKQQLAGGNGRYIAWGGLIALLSASVPYLLEVVPESALPFGYAWQSRFQLAFPLGVSAIYVYIFSHQSIFVRNFIYSLLITVFIMTNWYNYLLYQGDWYKQKAMISEFAKNETIQANSTFIVEQGHVEPIKRHYYYYEFNGMLSKAFGDQRRLVIDKADHQLTPQALAVYRKFIVAGQYAWHEPLYRISIAAGQTRLNLSTILQLRYYEATNKSRFDNMIRDIVVVQTTHL